MAIITISRQAGSGGERVARLLAERLGYRYVSRDQVTEAVTTASGIKRNAPPQETEGRPPSLWEQLVEQVTGDRETYRTALRSVVTELAAANNLVIVGHGTAQILGGLSSTVRVLLVAPLDVRARRLVAAGSSTEEAVGILRKQDRDSADYLRYLFEIEWLEPHHWDLVINTARTDLAAVAEMLTGYVETLVRGQGEQRAIAQMRAVSRVELALSDPNLGVDKVRVRVEDERLVIEGEALSREDRQAAEAVASRAAGEAGVENRIVLRPPSAV